MRYTIRWRYVLKLAAVLVAAGVGVFFLNRWQVGRQHGAFLRQADRAKADGDAEAEVKLLDRYLKARPDDVDARERLGRLVVAAAKSPREVVDGYLLVDDALRRDPGRDDLRRFAVETATRVGLIPEALGHLDELLRQHPGDADLEFQAARCAATLGRYQEAADRFGRAAAARPGLLDAHLARAALLRGQLSRPDEADAVVAKMLAANPQDHRAPLMAIEYWASLGGDRGRPAAAAARALAEAQKLPARETVGGAIAQLLATARGLAPDDRDVLRLSGVDLADRARLAAAAGNREEAERLAGEARAALGRAIERDPKLARSYLDLAALENDFRSPAAAAEVAGKGADAAAEPRDLLALQLEYLFLAGDAAGVERVLARLKAGGYAEARQALQRARLQGLRDDWEGAAAAVAALLGKKPPELAADPRFARQVQLFYGRCLEQLGEHDRRLEAHRAAVPPDPADPQWVRAQSGLAEALAAAGKPDEALAAFRKLAARTPAAWLPVARLEVARALRTADPAKRDWAPAEEALGRAEKATPGATDVVLLRADVHNARGQPAAARKLYDFLTADRPKEPAVWAAAALQDLRENAPDRAAQTLDAGRAAAGDGPDLRLARARVAAAAKDPDLPKTLNRLADGADAFGRGPHRRLLRGLADVATAAGQPDAAAGLLDRVAAAQGNNLDVQLARYDSALRAGDEKRMAEAAAAIARVSGPDGTHTRLVAALTAIWRAQQKNDPAGLAAARAGLEAVEKERPEWARAALALAVVCDLLKDPAAAYPRYERAVKSGERTPDAFRRLAELALAAGRPDQALEAFRQLPPGFAERPELAKLKARVLAPSDPKAALAAAERAVPPDDKDPQDHLWVAQVAVTAAEWDKAEAALRRALALQPDRPGPWLSLLQVQLKLGREPAAAQTAAEAEGKVAPGERDLFAAQAAVLLGRRADAAKLYEKARRARPDDLRAVLAEAEFLYRENRLADARQGFERALKLPGVTADQRAGITRLLALSLAADPNPEVSRQALGLLGYVDGEKLTEPPADEPPAARKTRVAVLALQKERAYRAKAAELLEANLGGLDADDLFQLAQLQHDLGNPTRVRVALASLSRKGEDIPLYLTWAAGWYLRAGDPAAAAPLVEKLARLQPDNLMTAELRARLYAARNQRDEAKKVLDAAAGKPDAPPGAVARVYEQVGLYDDAERVLRQAVEAARAARPGAALALAAYLGRRGRTGEALDAVDGARRAKVPAAAWGAAAVGAVYAAKSPPAADLARLAGWLDEARKAAPAKDKPGLGQLLASVKNLQGDYPGAIDLYEQALAADPRDVVALNNLAYLLSAKGGQYDRALERMDQAQKVAGPVPDLLDTRATILLQSGRPGAAEEAVKLLRAAVDQAPSGVAYFHLAQAELAAGRPADAAGAWRQAAQLGLAAVDLHPLERADYDKLAARFK